jgi:hypothetical protein
VGGFGSGLVLGFNFKFLPGWVRVRVRGRGRVRVDIIGQGRGRGRYGLVGDDGSLAERGTRGFLLHVVVSHDLCRFQAAWWMAVASV